MDNVSKRVVSPQSPLPVSMGGSGAATLEGLRRVIGVDKVANLAPADMPTSTSTMAEIRSAVQTLVGGAASDSDTLKKLASAVALRTTASDLSAGLATRATMTEVRDAISAALSELTAGAPGELDSFIEVYNRFLDADNNLSNLIAMVDGRLSKSSNLSDLTDKQAALANIGGAQIDDTATGSLTRTLSASKIAASIAEAEAYLRDMIEAANGGAVTVPDPGDLTVYFNNNLI